MDHKLGILRKPWNTNHKTPYGRIIISITWRDKKGASWIREQTKKILTTIKNKKSGHGQDTLSDEEIIDRQSNGNEGKEKEGRRERQRTRWRG